MRREDLARSVADAVTAVPGVVGLVSPASGVEVATLFAGGKVVGLRFTDDAVDIHIRVDRVPLRAVADEAVAAARRVLMAAGVDRTVRVTVEDVVVDGLDRRQRD